MSLLIIDNYDSFTYNLVELVRQCGYHDFRVYRNDEIEIADVASFDKILLSPGPGLPSESGMTIEIIQRYAAEKSILGVCLGHQAIAEVFGGKLYQPGTVYHGLQTEVDVEDSTESLFHETGPRFLAGLYHSWAVAAEGLPADLCVTARSSDGVIMGIRHLTYDVRGIQFHPESIMTPMGGSMIRQWLYPLLSRVL